MQEFITTGQWMQLPVSVKEKLKEIFNIHKTGPSEVRDHTIVRDGYTQEELTAKLSHEAMTKYLGKEMSFLSSWEHTLIKIDNELNPKIIPQENDSKKSK